MTELNDTNKPNDSVSLNKAAHLLGINELNKFDYKSLNSIRKLAKTLGCNEFDLMKSFQQANGTSGDAQTNNIVKMSSSTDKKTVANTKKGSISSKSKWSSNASQRVASFNNKKDDSTSCKLNKRNENVSFNDNNYKKLLNLKKIGFHHKSSSTTNTTTISTNSSKDNTNNNNNNSRKEKLLKLKTKNENSNDTTTNNCNKFQRTLNNINNKKKQTNRFINLNKAKAEEKEVGEQEEQEVEEEQDIQVDQEGEEEGEVTAVGETVEIEQEKEHSAKEESDLDEGDLYFDIEKLAEHDMDLFNETSHIDLAEISPAKREVVLVKDQSMGFGFIAGSEKPLVIRFVSPGKILFNFSKKRRLSLRSGQRNRRNKF